MIPSYTKVVVRYLWFYLGFHWIGLFITLFLISCRWEAFSSLKTPLFLTLLSSLPFSRAPIFHYILTLHTLHISIKTCFRLR